MSLSSSFNAQKNSSSSWPETRARVRNLRIVYNDSRVIRRETIASYLSVLRILCMVFDVVGKTFTHSVKFVFGALLCAIHHAQHTCNYLMVTLIFFTELLDEGNHYATDSRHDGGDDYCPTSIHVTPR